MIKRRVEKIIETLKTGSPADIRVAKKDLKNIVNKDYLYGDEKQRKKVIKDLLPFIDEARRFENIKDLDHQVYFVDALNEATIAIGKEELEFFQDFIYKYIQHPSGKLRQAILRIGAKFYYFSIDVIIENCNDDNLSKKEKETCETKRFSFFLFLDALENLMGRHYSSEYDKYEYIDDMPSCIYKSLEMLFWRMTRDKEMMREYSKFLKEKEDFERQQFEASKRLREDIMKVSNMSEKDILKKRQEVERDMRQILSKMDTKLTWEDMRYIIYNEEPMEGMKKIADWMDLSDDIDKANDVLQVINDAWNFFPHKKLDGLCPIEMIKKMDKEKNFDDNN